MEALKIRNQKIIDAVIEKANRVCPESLALIGIYGSFETGDFYEKSDLDLLILINDERGRKLGCTFLQDDLEVGHDLYCTTWEDLQRDALYQNPNIAKLMDSKIVYASDECHIERLEALRKEVKERLLSPLSREDYGKAEAMMREAEHFYLTAMLAETMADLWEAAGAAVYFVENAIAMLNKTYFRRGTRRAYEELERMGKRPDRLCEMIECVLAGNSAEQVKEALTALIQETMCVFRKVEAAIPAQRKPVTAASLRGTYEEMFSNWRNKLHAASRDENRHLAFMSMLSLNAMLSELGGEMEIASYEVFGGYHPQDLGKTAQAFDDLLKEYLTEYEKADLQVMNYQDIDAFIAEYLA